MKILFSHFTTKIIKKKEYGNEFLIWKHFTCTYLYTKTRPKCALCYFSSNFGDISSLILKGNFQHSCGPQPITISYRRHASIVKFSATLLICYTAACFIQGISLVFSLHMLLLYHSCFPDILHCFNLNTEELNWKQVLNRCF